MHPLKLVQIKNPFGILQTNPQIPREWVGNFDFQKNMFGWDTLMHSLNHFSVGFPNTFMQQTILWVEYFNIYQLSICFSNVVVALLDGKLGGLSSRGRLSAEPLLDCSTLDRQGGLRLVRLLLLLTWPTACWPSMARPQPFQYSQYTLTKAQSM